MFKDEVHEILEENKGEFVPSKTLVHRLNKDRNQIWKAIQRLKDEGFEIESKPKYGYRLIEDTNKLHMTSLRKFINDETKIELHEEITSTNDYAKMLEHQEQNLIIIAKNQTKGRGRQNRSFYCEKDQGLYFSMVLHDQLTMEKISQLSSLVALGVVRAIKKVCHKEVQIKWINDIYDRELKIGGILCEADTNFDTGIISKLIIGIGLNLGRIQFPEHLKKIAASLEVECNYNELLGVLYEEVMKSIQSNLAMHLDEYKYYSCVIGERIDVLEKNQTYDAKVIDLDQHGALVIEKACGEIKKLISNEISIRRIRDEAQ